MNIGDIHFSKMGGINNLSSHMYEDDLFDLFRLSGGYGSHCLYLMRTHTPYNRLLVRHAKNDIWRDKELIELIKNNYDEIIELYYFNEL